MILITTIYNWRRNTAIHAVTRAPDSQLTAQYTCLAFTSGAPQ